MANSGAFARRRRIGFRLKRRPLLFVLRSPEPQEIKARHDNPLEAKTPTLVQYLPSAVGEFACSCFVRLASALKNQSRHHRGLAVSDEA